MVSTMLAALMAYVMAAKSRIGTLNTAAGEWLLDRIHDYSPSLGARVEWQAQQMAADTRGQLGFGTILAALTVVITVMLALIVVDQFDVSLGDPTSSSLSQAEQDVLGGFADMASLIGPLLLVAIAVVIIFQVQRVRT